MSQHCAGWAYKGLLKNRFGTVQSAFWLDMAFGALKALPYIRRVQNNVLHHQRPEQIFSVPNALFRTGKYKRLAARPNFL